jgi:hypothetical protein
VRRQFDGGSKARNAAADKDVVGIVNHRSQVETSSAFWLSLLPQPFLRALRACIILYRR